MKTISTDIKDIIKKAENEHQLSRGEIARLLRAEGHDRDYLYRAADHLRAKHLGDEVHLRGIIEFSSYCQRNCKYCGLRKDNDNLTRYRLAPEEIIEVAEKAAGLGYGTIVLQSGEDDFSADMLVRVIRKIKTETEAAVTLCVGERSYDEYRLWREAGADRYLLKHELSDPEHYDRLHPGMTLSERLERLEWLRELGYQIGSGNIIGLPEQSVEDIARDILMFKELDLHMVGIGPFISHPDTPLGGAEDGSVELSVKVVAVTRLLMPLTHLPATTALGTLDPEGRQKALKAGANVVMPNVTPSAYRADYEIYPDKICIEEKAENCRECIGGIITSLGRTVAEGCGHSPKMS
ncbi:MAG: [FeFe] hydrogenase H-cluster radical SAM maturase HydE [Bacillota bacterium]